jgi:hypothetical protein
MRQLKTDVHFAYQFIDTVDPDPFAAIALMGIRGGENTVILRVFIRG